MGCEPVKIPLDIQPAFGIGDVVEVTYTPEWAGERHTIVGIHYDRRNYANKLTYTTGREGEGDTDEWSEEHLKLIERRVPLEASVAWGQVRELKRLMAGIGLGIMKHAKDTVWMPGTDNRTAVEAILEHTLGPDNTDNDSISIHLTKEWEKTS